MLTLSVPCDDVSSSTVQAVRVASRVEVTGNDEPGVKRGESVHKSDNCSVNTDVTVPGGR